MTVSGATLGGTGSIGGGVTVNGNGHLAPGIGPKSVGTLTVGGLNLSTGSIVDFDLGSTGNSDRTIVDGGLQFGSITLNISALAGFSAGTYELFSYTSAGLLGTVNFGIVLARL